MFARADRVEQIGRLIACSKLMSAQLGGLTIAKTNSGHELSSSNVYSSKVQAVSRYLATQARSPRPALCLSWPACRLVDCCACTPCVLGIPGEPSERIEDGDDRDDAKEPSHPSSAEAR